MITIFRLLLRFGLIVNKAPNIEIDLKAINKSQIIGFISASLLCLIKGFVRRLIRSQYILVESFPLNHYNYEL